MKKNLNFIRNLWIPLKIPTPNAQIRFYFPNGINKELIKFRINLALSMKTTIHHQSFKIMCDQIFYVNNCFFMASSNNKLISQP